MIAFNDYVTRRNPAIFKTIPMSNIVKILSEYIMSTLLLKMQISFAKGLQGRKELHLSGFL